MIPNYISDAINATLDTAFIKVPGTVKDRELLYGVLVKFFSEHGSVPELTLCRNKATCGDVR